MRAVSIKGKKLYAVPWLEDGECTGCVFHEGPSVDCPNNKDHKCDDGGVMTGQIYIARTQKAVAKYVAERMDK